VMEVRLPGFDGVSAVRQMIGAAPQARVVVLSAEVGGDLPLSALRAGAEGYLPKDLDSGALARALRKVADGEAVVPRALTKPLLESLRRMPDSGWRPLHSQLTTREWEIIELLDAGACTRGIAEELTLSRATVYSHVKNILRKLEVKSRAEAVLAAQRLRPAEVGITT